jgi:hypothetical protein
LKQSTGIGGSAAAEESGYRASVDAPLALAEVWGDTVDLRHLAWSVVLGIAISVGAFEAGKVMLSSIASDPALVRADAMLVGLGGCLLAGAVCAFLFRPKRIVIEQVVQESDRMDVLARLAEESGGIGSLADLPASARAELKELGLLELFAAYEASEKNRRGGVQ